MGRGNYATTQTRPTRTSRCVFCRRFDAGCNDRIFHSLACPVLRLAFMKHHGLNSFTFEVRELLMLGEATGVFDEGLEPSPNPEPCIACISYRLLF